MNNSEVVNVEFAQVRERQPQQNERLEDDGSDGNGDDDGDVQLNLLWHKVNKACWELLYPVWKSPSFRSNRGS